MHIVIWIIVAVYFVSVAYSYYETKALMILDGRYKRSPLNIAIMIFVALFVGLVVPWAFIASLFQAKKPQ